MQVEIGANLAVLIWSGLLFALVAFVSYMMLR